MAKLILIGGNEFKKKDGIDEYIADLSGGVLDLLPYAKAEDAGVEKTIQANERYTPLGVSVRSLQSQDLASPPAALSRVIYLTGGKSEQLMASIDGSALWNKIADEYKVGSINIAGTSAGAKVLFEQIVTKDSLNPGLGLIKGKILLAPHWNTLGDSAQVNFLDTYDQYQIIGVDENTAIVWEYGEAQVIGLGKVLISDQLVRNEYEPGDSFKLFLKFE